MIVENYVVWGIMREYGPGSQAARQRSAKPLFAGSNPAQASSPAEASKNRIEFHGLLLWVPTGGPLGKSNFFMWKGEFFTVHSGAMHQRAGSSVFRKTLKITRFILDNSTRVP